MALTRFHWAGAFLTVGLIPVLVWRCDDFPFFLQILFLGLLALVAAWLLRRLEIAQASPLLQYELVRAANQRSLYRTRYRYPLWLVVLGFGVWVTWFIDSMSA